MKAATFTRYGPPEEVVYISDIPQPTPTDNQVLVRVRATSVNDYDWSLTRGKPAVYRLMFGLTKPKSPLLGMELAGTVEAVGNKVEKFKVGDDVMGDTSAFGFGTFAEYMAINPDALVKKPQQIPFVEAAAIPHASTLAWQALVDIGRIQKNQSVLINGGGGGVGTLGLQIAKLYDCHVTGVDSSEKLENMLSLGFDEVIDYEKVNFTRAGKKYDLILDCKTCYPALSYPKVLKSQGKYVSIGGQLDKVLGVVFWGKIVSLFSSKSMHMLALNMNEGLENICQMYSRGELKCHIDGPYPLEQAGRQIQYFGDGKHLGKVVLEVN